MTKKEKKGFSEIDLTTLKSNRTKNHILFPNFTLVESIQVTTGSLNHIENDPVVY
jgi:hypothetical protein